MLTLTYDTTRITCTEANAPKYRAIIDSGKMPKIKKERGGSHLRDYPVFTAGMSTADYLSRYSELNERLLLSGSVFSFVNRAAPMLDPTIPEALEEADPDYIEPYKPAKHAKPSKHATVASLRRSLELILAIDPMQTAGTHDLWLALSEVRRIAGAALDQGIK